MPKKNKKLVEEEQDDTVPEVSEEPAPEEAPKKKFMYEKIGAQFSDAE